MQAAGLLPSMSDQPKKQYVFHWVVVGMALLCLASVWLVRRILHDDPLAFSSRGISAKGEVRLFMPSIVGAVNQYRTDYGSFPSGENAAIVAALRGKNPRGIIYFEPPTPWINPKGELIDPWKTPYCFDLSDPQNPRVWSCGKNRRDDGGAEGSDDIVSGR